MPQGTPVLFEVPDTGCWVSPSCVSCPLPRCWDEYSKSERRAAVHEVRRALGIDPPLSRQARARKRRRQRVQQAICAGE